MVAPNPFHNYKTMHLKEGVVSSVQHPLYRKNAKSFPAKRYNPKAEISGVFTSTRRGFAVDYG